ncbi:MAG TPA: hypothetical protein VK671_13460, partial [Mucilaginibacter sp.]|nr:hypothetical protein [Mucilaginibacter sp.]
MKKLFIMFALLISSKAFSQSIDLQTMLANKNLKFSSANVVQVFQDGDKKGITCHDNVWLKDVDFTYGTIEVDIRGRNEFLKSFP